MGGADREVKPLSVAVFVSFCICFPAQNSRYSSQIIPVFDPVFEQRKTLEPLRL